jgi:hypothetical protein
MCLIMVTHRFFFTVWNNFFLNEGGKMEEKVDFILFMRQSYKNKSIILNNLDSSFFSPNLIVKIVVIDNNFEITILDST